MYNILLIVALLLMSGAGLFAQVSSKPNPKPVLIRRVNGVVRDSLGKIIPSAAVRLVSSKDTLHTVTSDHGVFNFPAVHSENFTIEVQVMSYHPYYKKYFLNDTKPILVLPPVVMTSSLVQLKGIVVSTTKGPQERGDTTEFWAKDYIVRDYARLEDMLKRMEGFSTDANGMLSYHGKPVSRALFNGTKYFDGDVAAAIKELPADIVERIQIIQDNESGTGARQTASEPSSQTLNIITKADKSAGQMYQVNMEAGTQDRYTGALSARTIDGTKQWAVAAAGMQEPLGIIGSEPIGTISNICDRLGVKGGSGGSGGMSKNSLARVQYNNNIGLLKYDIGYLFNRRHSLSETENLSEDFFKEGSLKKNTKSREDNTITSHTVDLKAFYSKGDFTMMTMASAGISRSRNENFREIHQTGILENLQRLTTGKSSDVPVFDLSSGLKFFATRKVKLDIGVHVGSSSTDGSGHDNTDTYSVNTANPDSSLYLLQQQKTAVVNHSLTVALTYEWRKKFVFVLKTIPAFNKNTDINYRDQVIPGQPVKRLNDLSNDNMLLNYRLPNSLYLTYKPNEIFSLELRGNYEINWQRSRLHLKELDLSRRTTVFLPGITAKYSNKYFGELSLSYDRDIHLPTLLQLNTKPYYTSPFDVVIGNMNLENGLINRWQLEDHGVIPKINLDIIAGFNYSRTSNDIAGNRLIRIDTATNTIRTETYYLNVKGGDSKSLYYFLSKNISNMNITLKLDGRMEWGQQVYFANNSREQTDQRSMNYDFYAWFTPLKWLDIAPALGYSSNNNRNTLQPGRPLYNNEFNAQIKGAVYLPGDLKVNVSARQNIITANSLSASQHPFILNANMEKRFGKKKDAVISFVVMDAFQQNNNNIISQSVTGYSNAFSSVKSRYFLCQLAWYPQRFTRSKAATGARRGDGSFVQ